MTYVNKSAYWGDIDLEVTPQWYGERAEAMNVPLPIVSETVIGLIIDGEVVAVPVPSE